MKWFQLNPTIKETNKYLDRVVEDLKKRHGGVSSEEFEKALVDTTGISWKQVKNYKNHPKPSERLKNNSLVIRYIREAQRKDKIRAFKLYAYAVTAIALVFGGLIYYLTSPSKIDTFAVQKVIELLPKDYTKLTAKIAIDLDELTLRLGPIAHSKFPIELFNCTKVPASSLQHCEFKDNLKSPAIITAVLDSGIITNFSFRTTDEELIKKISLQLSKQVDKSLSAISAGSVFDRQFTVGDEVVEIRTTLTGHAKIIAAMVYFKDL